MRAKFLYIKYTSTKWKDYREEGKTNKLTCDATIPRGADSSTEREENGIVQYD